MITLTAETASEYDFVIGLDASGSMASPSTRYPGKTRWQEAQETIFGLASVLGQYDADGIDVVVFGGSVEVFEGVTAEKVSDIFSKRSPRGSTPLAEAITKIDGLNSDGKKAVALVFTDGEPDDRAAAEKAIITAASKLENDEDFTILFVQIGDDAGAAKFLAHLDDGLTSAKFDIVDTISAAEADKLEPIDLINKAINDWSRRPIRLKGQADMNGFAKIIDDGKKLFAAVETRFNAIDSQPAKIATAIFAAVILLMIVWAVLPWIGFIIAFVVVAFVVRAFWPAAPGTDK